MPTTRYLVIAVKFSGNKDLHLKISDKGTLHMNMQNLETRDDISGTTSFPVTMCS